jgi:ABC-type multidrug transport system permease subunit
MMGYAILCYGYDTLTLCLPYTNPMLPCPCLTSGLSATDDGERFFVMLLISSFFSICIAQWFRVIAAACPTAEMAQPLAGISTVIMVLFSGFIQPKNDIPTGWIWWVFVCV